MKKSLICMFFASILAGASAQAGNDTKRGTVGATELQINPWARSTGWAGANSSLVKGTEAMSLNIGGLANVEGTELHMASTRWLSGTDIQINTFGFGQKLGENGGVLGLSVMSMNLGNFKQTTEMSPDQDIDFQVSMLNMGLGYSKKFSNNIHGGILIRVISESIPDASAMGVAFDGGVQYTTSLGKGELDKDNLHIGVSLRNVGPEMSFGGDGLSYRAKVNNGTFVQSMEQRSASFELPAMLNIGAAYDWHVNAESRLTFAGNFVSNTASSDQIQAGAEYAFNEMFMVRGGFDYQKDILNKDVDARQSAYTGPTAGATVTLPFGLEKDKKIGIDYSFRATNTWAGTHSVGLKLEL